MGLGNAFDRLMDWTMDVDDNMVVGITKILGVSSIPVGIIAAPFIYIASQNAAEFERTLEDLDNRPTAVFQTVSQCKDDGYAANSCLQSKQNALDIAEQMGTAVTYSSRANCITNHGQCSEHTWMVPIVTSTGQTTITTYVPQSEYIPPVIAWQAASDDLSVSVPLYSTNDESLAIRRDGRTFELDF